MKYKINVKKENGCLTITNRVRYSYRYKPNDSRYGEEIIGVFNIRGEQLKEDVDYTIIYGEESSGKYNPDKDYTMYVLAEKFTYIVTMKRSPHRLFNRGGEWIGDDRKKFLVTPDGDEEYIMKQLKSGMERPRISRVGANRPLEDAILRACLKYEEKFQNNYYKFNTEFILERWRVK